LNQKSTLLFRATLTAIIAAVLVWQVTTRSLVAYLASSDPETALFLRSTDPTALLSVADRTLARMQQREQLPTRSPPETQDRAQAAQEPQNGLRQWAQLKAADRAPSETENLAHPADPSQLDAQVRDQVRSSVELALANDPLNARGLSLLGQLAHMAGDEAAVANFLRAAAVRSLRESAAVYWLMQASYDNRDYATALYCADALLRTSSQVSEYVMPVLLGMAESAQGRNDLKSAVLNNPPWRSNFLTAYAQYASDPRASLELILATRETPTPPTTIDLTNYLNALIGRKQYELAYYAWLQFLPPEQLSSTGFLFNGSFEIAPTGLPFDWVISEGTGVTIDIVPRPDRDGQRALLIEFGYGRVEFRGIEQLTALPAGAYEFRAKYKGDILGKRGLVWRVACVDAPSPPIGESPMVTGASPSWQDIKFSFIVPDRNCRAQHVRLHFDTRMSSEQLISGSILYDELSIARVKEVDRP
jgi:hypothetical protein